MRPRAKRLAAEAVRFDLGPEIRRQQGHLQVIDAIDPDDKNRKIRRAEVRSHADYLLRRGGIDLPEYLACRRWAELREIAGGARDLPGILAQSARVAPWMRGEPSRVQLQAVEALRHAEQVLGPTASRLMDLFARDGANARSIAAMDAADDRVTMGAIRAALRRCAELWGL